MSLSINEMFSEKKVLIACVHLPPLPGAPQYSGSMEPIFNQALSDAEIFRKARVCGVIVENFRDRPFFPDTVPAETIAAMAAVTRELRRALQLPIGVNVLRNDARAALAVAAAAGAEFIRVNVHMGVVVSEQGIIQGKAHETLRLRKSLGANVAVFADVGVKHAAPLASRGLAAEAFDAAERGHADALIVSGELTGREVKEEDVETVSKASPLPLFIGSGATSENIAKVLPRVRGVIVGTALKKDGRSENAVDEVRVNRFVAAFRGASASAP